MQQSLRADGRVVGAGRVTKKRIVTARGIVIGGGIVRERVSSFGGIVATSRIIG